MTDDTFKAVKETMNSRLCPPLFTASARAKLTGISLDLLQLIDRKTSCQKKMLSVDAVGRCVGDRGAIS